MNFSEKLKRFFLKEDPNLPTMEPPVARKRGEMSPGTVDILEKGYRVPFVDTLRGVCIIAAFLYEFIYIIHTYGLLEGTSLSQFSTKLLTGDSFGYWLYGFQLVFVVISGMSVGYSRNVFKGAVRLGVCALIITLGSGIFFGFENAVWFGMVHMLAVCWAIYGIKQKKDFLQQFEKVGLTVWMVAFLIMFLVTKSLTPPRLYIGAVEIPYYFLGFTPADFSSIEFFGIFPWVFVFFCGISLANFMRDGFIAENTYKFRIPGLDIIGRNGMFIYLLHYPVVYGILLIADKLI